MQPGFDELARLLRLRRGAGDQAARDHSALVVSQLTLMGVPGPRRAVFAVAALGLCYIPFGTRSNLAVFFPPRLLCLNETPGSLR